jgi:hypothetical protein
METYLSKDSSKADQAADRNRINFVSSFSNINKRKADDCDPINNGTKMARANESGQVIRNSQNPEETDKFITINKTKQNNKLNNSNKKDNPQKDRKEQEEEMITIKEIKRVKNSVFNENNELVEVEIDKEIIKTIPKSV